MVGIICSLIAALLAVDGQAEVHGTGGEIHRGKIVEYSGGDRLTIETADGLKELNARGIYTIYFPLSPPKGSKGIEAGIQFSDGGYLGGMLTGGDGESLYFHHPDLGRCAISIDLIRSIVLDSPEIPRDFDTCPGGPDDDFIYKRQEGLRGRNYISGTLIGFSSTGLTFECSLGVLDFTFSDLEAVSLAGSDEAKLPEGPRVMVVLREHLGVFRAVLQRIDSRRIVLGCVFGGEKSLPLEAVESLVFQGEGFAHLGDLTPVLVEEVPYIGSREYFLYPHRKDRSVTGRALTAGGRTFAKGIGLHARTALTFDLGKNYLAFESFAGLSDEVVALPARGSVVFRIDVDGIRAFESPVMRGGDPPLKLPRIDLNDASRLVLTVDFADAFDSGDRALFGNPVLIRIPNGDGSR